MSVDACFMQHIAAFKSLIAGVGAKLLLILKNVAVDASAGCSVAYIEDVEKSVNIFV